MGEDLDKSYKYIMLMVGSSMENQCRSQRNLYIWKNPHFNGMLLKVNLLILIPN